MRQANVYGHLTNKDTHTIAKVTRLCANPLFATLQTLYKVTQEIVE